MAKISIISPMYNAERSIENMIKSVLVQTFIDWELLIINDGSTDNSSEVVNFFLKEDKRIKLYSKTNSGPAEARNTGIKYARSEYIVFIDADDTLKVTALETLYKCITNSYNVDMVCAGYYEYSNRHKLGKSNHDFTKYYPHETISNEEFIANIFYGLTGVLWGKIFKTKIIKENYLTLDRRLFFSEDLLFVFKYAKKCKKINLCYDFLYKYNRLENNGLTRVFNLSHLQNLKILHTEISKEIESTKKEYYNEIFIEREKSLSLQILKNHSNSTKELKYIVNEISKYSSFSQLAKKNWHEKLYIYFIEKENWKMAVFIERLLKILRTIKNG